MNKKDFWRIAAIAAFLLLAFVGFAQEAPAEAWDEVPAMMVAADSPEYYDEYPIVGAYPEGGGREWSTIEIFLGAGLMCFCLGVLALMTWLILKNPSTWTPQTIVRAYGLTLIVSMSVMLVAVGYSKEQIGPTMGLLGVIAGYLLGNDRGTSNG